MLPSEQLVKAADTGMDINIHFYDKDQKYKGKVNMQYWQEATATVSTVGVAYHWGDNDVKLYPLTAETDTEGADWYGINLKGSVEGFQFTDADPNTSQISTGSVYNASMASYKGDLYYRDGVWYKDNPIKNANAAKLELVTAKEVYYLVGDESLISAGWNAKANDYALTKQADGNYAITLKNVAPGKYQIKALKDPDNFAWNCAWGGTGEGGNYVVTVTKKSDVEVALDPKDETKQLKVTVNEIIDAGGLQEKSPTYNADGTLTFYYESVASGASIGVKGNVTSAKKKSMIRAEEVGKLENGHYVYVATSAAIDASGIYKYTFCELDKDGKIVSELGDPASTTKYAGTGAYVRNPIVSDIGLITIYYPYDGEGAKAYFAKKDSAKKTYAVGDTVIAEDAKNNGYTGVSFKQDDNFDGGDMYAASFYDETGEYIYCIVNAEGKVVKDLCNCGNHTIKVDKVDTVALSVESPQVITETDGSNTVKFMYYDPTVTGADKKIYVSGQFNGWPKPEEGTAANQMVEDEKTKGVWSLSIPNFAPGKYQYKIIVNGSWMADPLATMKEGSDGNSVVVVPGLVPEVGLKVEKGKNITLPTELQLYKKNSLEVTTVSDCTCELAKAVKGAKIENGVLSVDETFAGNSIAVKFKKDSVESVYNVEVVDKMYTFTMHYYSDDKTEYANRDLWIWTDGGAGEAVPISAETKEDENGRLWATATYQVPSQAIHVIVRSKGEWTYQESERQLKLAENKLTGEFWMLKGNSQSFDQNYETFPEEPQKKVIVVYDRPGQDYEGWNLYTWTALDQYKNKSLYFEEVNGKYQTTFAVPESITKVEYLLRSGEPEGDDWSKITKDLNDRSIEIPADQSVVKVYVKQGEATTTYVPYNKGYAFDPDHNQLLFYYRDDESFFKGTQKDDIKKVVVTVNGQAIALQYNAENERFEGALTGLQNGDYSYHYTVTDANGQNTDVLDKFNNKKTEDSKNSLVSYKELTTNLTATINKATMNYSENNLLEVSYDNTEIEPQEFYADLSALGGKAKTAIDPTLKKLTIAVQDTIAPGEKEIPVVLVDQYNKTTKTTVKVNVVAKETVANDFDWDESVIYFMVTDRFCDGNETNNDAYSKEDYDKSNGSAYHGGDFAGVTQKLDYLKDLGINTIWITPVVENVLEPQIASDGTKAYGYAGYWASDFQKLNAHLGTEAEFKELIAKAHEKGIRIMVDVVLNHSGYGTKDAEKYSQFANMFRENDVQDDNLLGGNQDGLPDFATEKEKVRNTIIGWQTAWMQNYDIDYFRVDTVKHVDRTTWSAFKNALTQENPNFKMIGECYGASYTDDAGYLGSGTFDSLLDFSFNDMATNFVQGKLNLVEQQLEDRNGILNSSATFGNFLSSHDEDGFAYNLIKNGNCSEEKANALAKVAASLSITAKGQPIIYYGEEIGLTGANNYPKAENRYDMKFDDENNQLSEQEKATLEHYKKLLAIRKHYSKLFAKGSRTKIAGSDEEQYVAFTRSYKGTDVLVALNIADTMKKATIKVPSYAGKEIVNMYNGQSYQVDAEGNVEIRIPSNKKGGTAIFAVKPAEENVEPSTEASTAPSTAPTTEATTQPVVDGNAAVTTVAPVLVSDAAVRTVNNIDKNTMQNVIAGNTTSKFSAVAADGSRNAIWTFSAADLVRGNAKKASGIDFTCVVTNASIVADVKAILDQDANNSDGALIRFTQQGNLPVDASVQLDITGQTAIKADSLVYVYHVNAGKLEQIAVQNANVATNGAVTIHIAQGGDYVLLAKAPSKTVVKTLLSNVTAKLAKTSLKKGKTTTIKATIKDSILTKVSNFKDDSMSKVQSAHLGVTISYKSSNKKIATVSSKGKVTAKKKGSCKIQVVVRLSNGQKKVISKKLTVKATKKKTTKKKTTKKKTTKTTKKTSKSTKKTTKTTKKTTKKN